MPDPETLAYRRALGAFATGVAVVTIRHGGEVLGVTINSFCSVSLRPKLVLWGVDEGSRRGQAFVDAERFVINILGDGDDHISDRFAKGDGYRLGDDEIEAGPGDAPLLKGALTWLACERRERSVMGDHTVLVGEVTDFGARDGEGLVFYRGRYARLHIEE